MRRTLTLLLSFVLTSAALAIATVTLVTARPPVSDTVNWGQIGSDFTIVPYAFLVNSGFSDPMLGHFGRLGFTGEIFTQGSTWLGNFAPGDRVLWAPIGAGPLTLVF